jgi:hypothetical protein
MLPVSSNYRGTRYKFFKLTGRLGSKANNLTVICEPIVGAPLGVGENILGVSKNILPGYV